MFFDKETLKLGWKCKCPRCKQGNLYKPGFSLSLKSTCDICGLALDKNDSADGPAVFMIFAFGFALVPLALLLEVLIAPPLWLHAVIWGTITLVLTLGLLKPLKAFVIALQYKHRKTDWD